MSAAESRAWVTSDWHLNHTNIAGPAVSAWASGFRAFGSVSEMNECILKECNESVAEGDTLWFLGDFAFGDKQAVPALFERVLCRDIRVVLGNHDTWIARNVSALPKHVAILGGYHELRVKGSPLVVLSHYPLEVWNEQARGAVHLHGHSHGSLRTRLPRRFDVGVDTNGLRPYNLDELVKRLGREPLAPPVDHHNKDQKGW